MRHDTEEEGFPIGAACRALHVSRAGYYQWRFEIAEARVAENQRIAGLVREIPRENPGKGYRRIRDDLDRYYHAPVIDKRALRICRSLGIQSMVKYAPQGCTRSSSSPRHLAENILDRRFYADRPNEKWLTDVAEFHYYVGPTLRKFYLSAILGLCDRRIVSFAIQGIPTTPPWSTALWIRLWKPIPASIPCSTATGGSAYTTQIFHDKLASAGITQSMSRVGKCIDNGPMEGFWGILKRERYYGTSREQLVRIIQDYIVYYIFCRLQRGLGVRTPTEVHDRILAA